MLTKEEYNQIDEKINSVLKKLNDIYAFDLKIAAIHYDIAGGNVAGMAKYPSMTMHLNEKMAKKLWKDFIDNTIPHEICHLGVYRLCEKRSIPFPKNPHGNMWKLMMWEVGSSPRARFTEDTSDLKKRVQQYKYSCNCKEGVMVSPRIHKNIIEKKKAYTCVKCGIRLINGTKVGGVEFSWDDF